MDFELTRRRNLSPPLEAARLVCCLSASVSWSFCRLIYYTCPRSNYSWPRAAAAGNLFKNDEAAVAARRNDCQRRTRRRSQRKVNEKQENQTTTPRTRVQRVNKKLLSLLPFSFTPTLSLSANKVVEITGLIAIN